MEVESAQIRTRDRDFVVYMKCSQHRLNANKHLIRCSSSGLCFVVLLCTFVFSRAPCVLRVSCAFFLYHIRFTSVQFGIYFHVSKWAAHCVCIYIYIYVRTMFCVFHIVVWRVAAGVDMFVCFASLVLHVFAFSFFFHISATDPQSRMRRCVISCFALIKLIRSNAHTLRCVRFELFNTPCGPFESKRSKVAKETTKNPHVLPWLNSFWRHSGKRPTKFSPDRSRHWSIFFFPNWSIDLKLTRFNFFLFTLMFESS